ncbi:uncharacterized protein LOC132914326 [Bombus pascuorum]|uniref:uncharacterized protein LOC132914326 n=1 Tax=Bombus pascuorum TaxID=65598 RepID=UPI002132EB7B|nr:uncharacterized protein LOC132914326 [Bombus pascuorum]XP_060829345.1 uncharacterized protein LOC132914326 [Bombus pascuorum]XP_060829346.1 uncharacterized protein LOC132914326 [Bombus pascuorum]
MTTFFLFCCVVIATVVAEEDAWTWKHKDEQQSDVDRASYRYQVNENLEDLGHERPLVGFRPQNSGPYGSNGRPIVSPSYPGNKEVLVGPGGPTGIIKRPSYTANIDDGELENGFVPSWVKDDPRYREYDTCKCRYSFNCPSNGLKFGSCSKDKKYCCFNSRKYPALVSGQYGQGHRPSYPGGPNKYGPATFVQPSNNYGNRRPQGSFTGANRYPGNYHLPGENPEPYPRPHSNPYEQNYDYNDFDIYSRSLNKNQTQNANADEKV